ncbi:hypothetical protein GJ654_20270 [Rhodoblastus acidophilus]|uniref:Thymidylate kinase n=1 Tax=Rhodoblastus acidophilus TaxID=1074 RepID=A0A6N8DUQ4_RHOAC|nr:hypothetical protein [Rhodoblastus acidophilus]MCW2275168.1 hypothetical protein [Rhodoblastus acidophilus]MTV33315.1 hypothetical protein [Rhodoblastus acidophilus]
MSLAVRLSPVTDPTPQPPAILARLIESFRQQSVAYCCWKNPSRLPDSFAGRSDLDLLIARTARATALQIFASCGFKHAPDAAWHDDPSVLSFLGFDESSGALLHVHAHFRLVVGPPLFKNDRIPCETGFLSRAPMLDNQMRVLSCEDRALLLIIRAQCELSWADPVVWRHRRRNEQKFRDEFAGLAADIRPEVFLSAATHLFGPELAQDVLALAHRENAPFAPFGLRTRIRRALAPYRKCGGFEAMVAQGFRAIGLLFGVFNRNVLQTPRTWRRRAPGGGVVIAFVGVDGSGKSTAAAGVRQWLGGEIDVVQHYFGTGEGAPSLVLAPFKLLARAISPFIKTKPKGASHGRISDRPPGPLYATLFAVWALAVALDKRHKLKSVQRAIRRGFVVVTDRYPQNEDPKFNDGPLLPRLPVVPEWLRRFEASVYEQARRTPPDLVVKLLVGPETVMRREPDMNVTIIKERLACIDTLRFQGARLVAVDAKTSLAEVTLAVRQAVWSII